MNALRRLTYTVSVASLGVSLIHAQSLPSAWVTGIATNYGGAQDGMDPSSASFGTKDGSCGFGLLSQSVYPYWSVGALSLSNQFSIAGPSNGCGQCFEIQCVNNGGQFAGRCSSAQSLTITVTDSCPECEADHLDLQALTFNKIAPMAIGRIDIKYRRVECTPPLPVSISIDNNIGVGGWLRLVVEKTAGFGGITAVSIRNTGASWMTMTNKFGSAWEVPTTPQLPWDFQFTSDSGQTITAGSLISSIGQIGKIPTGVQFSLSGQGTGNSISYSPTTTGDTSTATTPTSGAGATPPPTGAATTPPATSGASGLPPATAGSPPPSSSSSSDACCTDSQPTESITCSQQKAYGKCQDSWMVSGNFCQMTCGNCPASCTGKKDSPPKPSAGTTPPPALTGSLPPTPSYGSSPPAAEGNSPPAAGGNSPPAYKQSQPPAAGGNSPPAYQQSQPPAAGGNSPPAYQQSQPPPAMSTGASSPPSPTGSSGSVQTQSIGASTCTDTPPPDSSCSAMIAASGGACGTTLQQGTCDKSCYRC